MPHFLILLFAGFVLGISPVFAKGNPALPKLHRALVDGDTRGAFEIVVGLYEEEGMEFPGLLTFREQSSFELLSVFSPGSSSITQSSLLKAGEGRRYWETWSQGIAGGNWDHEAVFPTEEEARLVGNFAVLGIMAHEIAHALCEYHDLNLHDSPYREMLADEYAVRMMKLWAEDDSFGKLLESYRIHVTGGLRLAVPEGERLELPGGLDSVAALREHCATDEFPKGMTNGGYVSLQLDRQRFLLERKDLSSLRGFLASEMARRPARHWVPDAVKLETVQKSGVPAWMLVEGSPREFWEYSEENFSATIAGSLKLEDPKLLKGLQKDEKTIWQMDGPDRALLYLHRADLWKENPGRLLELKRKGKDEMEVAVLAASEIKPIFYSALSVDGAKVVLLTNRFGNGGLLSCCQVWNAAVGKLEPWSYDGLPFKGLSEDGELAEWGGTFHGRAILRGEDLVVSSESRIRVIRDGKVQTLAGDIRGQRDGEGAANVRLAGAKLLGFSGGYFYLQTVGIEDTVYRRLSWER